MNWLAPLRNASRSLVLESLENRELLDVGLGSEISDFASEDELKSALIEKAVAQHEWMFGQEVNNGFCIDWCGPFHPEFRDFEFFAVDDAGPLPSADFGDSAGGDGGAAVESFSETNVQVAGVDEGDIVETDGEYVYILSNNVVTIVDVRDQEHPRVASRVQLDENAYGREMYLDRDRLMVISNSSYYFEDGPFPVEPFGGPAIDLVADIAFFEPTKQVVVATVIDIEDREDAKILSETEIDGTLSNSRAIDGMGYLIVNDNLRYPTPEVHSVKFISEDGSMERTIGFYETEEQYRERIGTSILDVLPTYTTYDADGQSVGTGLVSTHADTFSTNDPNYGSVVSVVMIDMQTDLPSVDAGTTVMMNAGHQIFMSADNLYLFQSRWDGEEATSIMKFEIDTTEDRVTPTASGVVPGRMLDQFSADEVRGELRIATTTGWGNRSSSGVYVLEETDDDALEVKGSVDGLAKGERIFSARFVGYRAYVVTFRQVDPLFSINLIDPANPIVEGELKIPGFSEYLQPLDEDHLLAIGRDADPETGIAEGLQLSLFNVSEITDPQLVDRYTFEGGRRTYSPAEHDHHAFSYFPEFNTLAIPVHSGGGGAWIRNEIGRREWVPAEWDNSLHVFQVDVEEGFEFAGAVDHPSEVRRSLRVNDALYSVSYDTLKVNDIRDPSNQLGQLHYLPPANGGVVPEEPTAAHIDGLFEAIGTAENSPKFDMDGNSLVNNDDVDFLLETAARTQRGDANLDGVVNFADFLVTASNFGQEGGWADGDFNGDGVINLEDFTILSENFVA